MKNLFKRLWALILGGSKPTPTPKPIQFAPLPSVKSTSVSDWDGNNRLKISMVRWVGNGLLWCVMDNISRQNTKLFFKPKGADKPYKIFPGVEGDGTSSSAESYGYCREPFDGKFFLPMEQGDGQIIWVDKDGKIGAGPKQPKQLSNIAIGNVTAIQNLNEGINRLWDIVNGQWLGVEFNRLNDIVTGLCREGNEWVACDNDGGIQWGGGAYLDEFAQDVITFRGETYAFMKDGRVVVIKAGKIVREIINTGQKAMRAIVIKWKGADLLVWCTAEIDQLWCFNGKESRMLVERDTHRNQGKNDGKLLGESVTFDEVDTIYFSRQTDVGYEIIEVVLK